MTRLIAAAGFVAISTLAGCASGVYGPSIDTPMSPAPRAIDALTLDERRALLDRAQIFRPVDTAKLDLFAGPTGKGAFPPDAQVSCGFAYPKKPLSGMTPKFECAITPDDVVKVKYGEQNGEVFAEVAGTRLFWALGLTVDRMYPVSVTCLGCPENPYRASTDEWSLGKPGNVATRVFELATIERKFDGEAIEVPKFKGWSWQELERVADNTTGATRAEVDAFKLLAAFVQHVDSKAENQALVCPEDAMGKDRSGNATCARPFLMVKDLGSSFAAAGKLTFPKMELESWRSVKVWRHPGRCQAHLTSSIVGTLQHPTISEAGRRLLAERLSRLSDRQLHDLFRAARVDRRKDTTAGRQVTVEDWVQAFKEKRDQIVQHRCQT
jgi:hypothetical protein